MSSEDLPQDEEHARLLNRIGAGERSVEDCLSSLYGELREMAGKMMKRERDAHTLQPTALVHEAFLRLLNSKNLKEKGRLEFLSAAAVTMRRVLVDHARRVGTEKRGDKLNRVTLAGCEQSEEASELDLGALDTALSKLATLDHRQAKIVELRFFAGMTGQEIADQLGVSRNTVVRELSTAHAWLRREIQRN